MTKLFIPRVSQVWISTGMNYPVMNPVVCEWCESTLGPRHTEFSFMENDYDWWCGTAWMSSASLGAGEFCMMEFGSAAAATLFKMRWL